MRAAKKVRLGNAVTDTKVRFGTKEYWSLTPAQAQKLPIGAELGCGAYACAYEHALDPTKVIKFTSDFEDVKGSIIANKEGTERAVKSFAIYKLAGKGKVGREGKQGYALVNERLEHGYEQGDIPILAAHRLEAFEDVRDAVNDPEFRYTDDEIEQVQTACVPGVQGTINRPPYVVSEAECRRQVRIVADVKEALLRAGIQWHDAHWGNLMKRADGTWVASDLGVADYSKRHQSNPRVANLKGAKTQSSYRASSVRRCQKNSPSFERCVLEITKKEGGGKAAKSKAMAVCSVSVCGAVTKGPSGRKRRGER